MSVALTKRDNGKPSSHVPAFAKKRFCDVQYAVSKPAACAYSHRSGASCRARRDEVGESPLQRTASDAAVVESRARICERPNRSGKSAFVKGVGAQVAAVTLQESVARTLSVTTKRRLRSSPRAATAGTARGARGPGWSRSTESSCCHRAF